MRADEDMDRAVHQAVMDRYAVLGGCRTGQQRYMYGIAKRRQERFERLVVLVSQDLRRCHDTSLITVIHRQETAEEGDEGLTRTYVSLLQAVHLMTGLEVVMYLVDDAFLGAGKIKRQGFVQRVKTTSYHR